MHLQHLRSSKGVRTSNQIGRETPGEVIARRAGGKQEQGCGAKNGRTPLPSEFSWVKGQCSWIVNKTILHRARKADGLSDVEEGCAKALPGLADRDRDTEALSAGLLLPRAEGALRNKKNN